VPDRDETGGGAAGAAYLIGSASRSLHNFFNSLDLGWGGMVTWRLPAPVLEVCSTMAPAATAAELCLDAMSEIVADATENVATVAVATYFPKMSLKGTSPTAPGLGSPA
jgi:hypothetical protein